MTIKTEILQIELEKLILDNENPRNKPQVSQFDAIKEMLLEQDDHILNLAKSIIEKDIFQLLLIEKITTKERFFYANLF